jgi:hypothetical protein
MSLKSRIGKLLKATPDAGFATYVDYPASSPIYSPAGNYLGERPIGEARPFPPGSKIDETRPYKVYIGIDLDDRPVAEEPHRVDS